MTFQDRDSPPSQGPTDPRRPSPHESLRHGEVEENSWNWGLVVVSIVAALVVIAALVWAATDDEETDTNSPPSTIGRAPAHST